GRQRRRGGRQSDRERDKGHPDKRDPIESLASLQDCLLSPEQGLTTPQERQQNPRPIRDWTRDIKSCTVRDSRSLPTKEGGIRTAVSRAGGASPSPTARLGPKTVFHRDLDCARAVRSLRAKARRSLTARERSGDLGFRPAVEHTREPPAGAPQAQIPRSPRSDGMGGRKGPGFRGVGAG